MATTSEDVWRLLAELTAAQKETDKQLKEVSQQQKETELLLDRAQYEETLPHHQPFSLQLDEQSEVRQP